MKLQWNFNTRNSSHLHLLRGEDVFLSSGLAVIPSLAGLQAGENCLPGALFRHLKKRLCYPSAFLSTVLWVPGEQKFHLQVQPEIFGYFSGLWHEGLSAEVIRNWTKIQHLSVTCLWVQQLKYCKEKVLGFPTIKLTISFSSFLLASSVSTSTLFCHHQGQALCYSGDLDIASWSDRVTAIILVIDTYL